MLSRILVLCVSILFAFQIQAEPVENASTIRLGSEYNIAKKAILTELGEPIVSQKDCIAYSNLKYKGFQFNSVSFNFKNDKLIEMRFFINTPNKLKANQYVKKLADMMAKDYSLSMDLSDNSYFYKGGVSPKGIGHLFTISAAKIQGEWKAELRYGPL